MDKRKCKIAAIIFSFVLLTSCGFQNEVSTIPAVTNPSISVSAEAFENSANENVSDYATETNSLMPFAGARSWKPQSPYLEINSNKPLFTEEEKLRTDAFEIYSELDELGRCGTAFANVCKELRPTEERGKIGMIKPSGWHTSKYDKEVISDLYLYNRAHLLGYNLTGENDNEKNLITGTRYLNIQGMLPFENKVDKYLDNNPDNHVLYRVTPIFEGNDLVAQSVLMEAWSVEDKGTGVCFCVLCFNVQPGIIIDYATGENHLAEENNLPVQNLSENYTPVQEITQTDNDDTYSYVLNTNTKKIHLPSCESVKDTKEKNKAYTNKTVDELKSDGYKPCQRCHPS